jgi:hypothetical protein
VSNQNESQFLSETNSSRERGRTEEEGGKRERGKEIESERFIQGTELFMRRAPNLNLFLQIMPAAYIGFGRPVAAGAAQR